MKKLFNWLFGKKQNVRHMILTLSVENTTEEHKMVNIFDYRDLFEYNLNIPVEIEARDYKTILDGSHNYKSLLLRLVSKRFKVEFIRVQNARINGEGNEDYKIALTVCGLRLDGRAYRTPCLLKTDPEQFIRDIVSVKVDWVLDCDNYIQFVMPPKHKICMQFSGYIME